MSTNVTLDRLKPKVRESRFEKYVFSAARRAELDYARKLRQLARNVGMFINSLFPQGEPAHPGALAELHRTLRGYAEVIRPWAQSTAARMIADVSRRDIKAWKQHGERMSRAIHRELQETPVGDVVRERLAAQVQLITSIPIDAANRVHELTLEGLTAGRRASDVAREILKSSEITQNRATLIARTETGRTVTEFTKARAEALGSTHFTWRSAKDRDVRKMHKHLEGTVHRWDEPPVAELDGTRHLPGAFPNCRCFAEPIVPDYV